MIQDIATYTIVIWALWQVIKFFLQFFTPDKGASACSSCTNGGCKIKTELIKSEKVPSYNSLKLVKTNKSRL